MKTYWKLAVRNLWKHKTVSIINILGLSVGLAAAIFIMMRVSYENNFDKNWENSDRIYRIAYNRYQNGERIMSSARTLGGMAPVLKEKIPEIQGSTQLFKDVVTVYNEKTQIQDINMFVADSTFFSVFKLNFINQAKANPLSDLYSAVISESAALSLFGTTDAVGKWFKVCQGWRFVVMGVFRNLPSDTHIPFDMLLSSQTYSHYFQNWDNDKGCEVIRNPKAYINNRPVTSWSWGYNGQYTYVLVRKGTAKNSIESKIARIAPAYTQEITKSGGKAEFALQPITGIHLDSHLENEITANGNKTSVLVLLLIALVIICIAWINFINLTLIRAVGYAKSIGLQKIAGASKIQLTQQFLIEAFITNFISIVLALLFVLLIKNIFLSVSSIASIISIESKYIAALCAFVVCGIAISGLYPAFYFSKYNPTELFKKTHIAAGQTVDLRKFFVIVQFIASIFLIISVCTVYKQIYFMKTRDLGININQTLVTFSPPTQIGRPQRLPQLNTYKQMIEQIPGVRSIATSSLLPGKEILWKRQDIRKLNDTPNTAKTYAYAYIDFDFLKTFDLKLLAGRDFTESENENSNGVMLNESALHQLGLRDVGAAVGSFILVGDKQYQIIGIVKDYHQESLQHEIMPIVYFYGYQWISDIGYYSIKINGTNVNKIIKQIEETWNKVYPEDHFKYFFLDKEFDRQYKAEQSFGILFLLFTGLAIFIASIGLFGLTMYTTNQQSKAIGIRKINGATVSDILVMLNTNTLKSIGIAFLIACPIAYIAMHKWLEQFAYKTTLSWWIFAIAGLLVCIITAITVSWQSYRAASANPVDAIKRE
jgi:putative ABC transport system permease protein